MTNLDLELERLGWAIRQWDAEHKQLQHDHKQFRRRIDAATREPGCANNAPGAN